MLTWAHCVLLPVTGCQSSESQCWREERKRWGMKTAARRPEGRTSSPASLLLPTRFLPPRGRKSGHLISQRPSVFVHKDRQCRWLLRSSGTTKTLVLLSAATISEMPSLDTVKEELCSGPLLFSTKALPAVTPSIL